MIDCSSPQPAHDLAVACLADDAVLRAAAKSAHAALLAGGMALGAGVLAFLGAGAVLLNGGRDRRAVIDLQAQTDRHAVVHMAAVYRAELRSLWAFLDSHGVVGTLLSNAETAKSWDFTPGECWLLTYTKDPATIGLFASPLAEAIAYCFPRTLNELGRLRWLHKWRPVPFNPQALCHQLRWTAETLTTLGAEAMAINKLLDELV